MPHKQHLLRRESAGEVRAVCDRRPQRRRSLPRRRQTIAEPDERCAQRHARAGPLLDQLHEWLLATFAKLSKKSELAGAIRYALTRWSALTRYRYDGRIEIDNNAVERALRTVALGRKNYLFAGADCGGERAATIYSLIA